MLRDYKLVNNGSVVYNDDWAAYEVVIGDDSYLIKAEKKAHSSNRVKDLNGYSGTFVRFDGKHTIFDGDDGQTHRVLSKNVREV